MKWVYLSSEWKRLLTFLFVRSLDIQFSLTLQTSAEQSADLNVSIPEVNEFQAKSIYISITNTIFMVSLFMLWIEAQNLQNILNVMPLCI